MRKQYSKQKNQLCYYAVTAKEKKTAETLFNNQKSYVILLSYKKEGLKSGNGFQKQKKHRGKINTSKKKTEKEENTMPAYLVKIFLKTVGSGRVDPLSLTILAVAGGVALIEHCKK